MKLTEMFSTAGTVSPE